MIVADQSARDIAMSHLDKNIIVVAGAGTGKTTLLIERIINLIVQKNIPVERIVALTFTKKAAEEMRARLEVELRELGQEKALLNLPKAQIGTIHSFAGYLLRLYPIQAKVDPHFKEDDGSFFEDVFEKEWQSWLGQELKRDSITAKKWAPVLSQVLLSDIKELAMALTSPNIEPENLNKDIDLKSFCQKALDDVERLMNQYPIPPRATVFGPALQAMRDVFYLGTQGKGALEKYELVEKLSASSLPGQWGDDPSAKKTIKHLREQALAFLQVDDDLLRQLQMLLRPFLKRVQSELNRQGIVSFDGLLVFARRLLRDHKEVRAQLKKQFDVFLIDEFQDTDPLQGEILLYLSEEETSQADHWKQVRLSPGRLFVVGDPKQSIYRFRGADMAAFEEVQNLMMAQGAEEALLQTNFRSHAGLLEPVNSLFSQTMRPEPYIQPAYVELISGREDRVQDGVQLIMLEGSGSADDFRLAEARFIADWVVKNKEKTPYRDMALLFRSAHAFGPYLDTFKERGIPYVAEGEKTFYQQPEVLDLLNMLEVVADPENKLAVVGVLRSVVGAWSDREIYDAHQAGRLMTGPVYKFLSNLAAQAPLLPVPDLIQAIFSSTWFLELTAQKRHGEQALANVIKVRQLAEKWASEVPLTAADFVRRFRHYHREEREEGENPLADSHVNAVKLMTIHKAKGLEFPVVFLPNLGAPKVTRSTSPSSVERDWRSNRVGCRLNKAKKISSSMLIIQEEIKRKEEAEAIRVFYVAMTRAKNNLFLFLKAKPEPSSGFAVLFEKTKALGLTTHVVTVTGLAVEEHKAPVASPMSPENLDDIIARVKARQENWVKANASRLFLSPSYLLQEPEKFHRVDDEETRLIRDQAIQLGLLSHKVLEEWDFKTPARSVATALSKALVRSAALLEISDTDIIKEAKTILARFMKGKTYKKLQGVKILGREIPFLYPATDVVPGAQLMQGVIDILYEEGGRLVVGDYKTNRVLDGSRYDVQGRVYRTAVERALKKQVDFELIFLREPVS